MHIYFTTSKKTNANKNDIQILKNNRNIFTNLDVKHTHYHLWRKGQTFFCCATQEAEIIIAFFIMSYGCANFCAQL